MKIYVVIQESGEHSGMECRNVFVTSHKEVAFRHGWLQSMNCWRDHFYIEDWSMDNDTSIKVSTYILDSNRLQKTYISSVLADIEKQLETSNDLPDILRSFVYDCSSWRK